MPGVKGKNTDHHPMPRLSVTRRIDLIIDRRDCSPQGRDPEFLTSSLGASVRPEAAMAMEVEQ